MSVIQLKGTKRESLGKGGARKARAAGNIPSVLYGHKETPVALAVGSRDFKAALRQHKGGNAIVNLNLDGTEITALVRDAQLESSIAGLQLIAANAHVFDRVRP